MKKLFFLLCSLIIIAACAPTSKTKYMTQFGDFIEEVTNDYKTYDDSAWAKKFKQYQKFTTEWYEKFENELTLKDEVKIATYKAKWALYYNLDGVSSAVKEVLEDEDVQAVKKSSIEYVENEMMEDIKSLGEKAQQIGSSLLEEAREVLDEIQSVN